MQCSRKMSMVACGVTQPWLEVWLCSSLACYFLFVFISCFRLQSGDDACHRELLRGLRKAIHAVPSMPSTELASIIVHFFIYVGSGTVRMSVYSPHSWSLSGYGWSMNHRLFLGVWLGTTWCGLPGELWSCEFKTRWVLFWVNLGQWFLTADRPLVVQDIQFVA